MTKYRLVKQYHVSRPGSDGKIRTVVFKNEGIAKSVHAIYSDSTVKTVWVNEHTGKVEKKRSR